MSVLKIVANFESTFIHMFHIKMQCACNFVFNTNTRKDSILFGWSNTWTHFVMSVNEYEWEEEEE